MLEKQQNEMNVILLFISSISDIQWHKYHDWSWKLGKDSSMSDSVNSYIEITYNIVKYNVSDIAVSYELVRTWELYIYTPLPPKVT